MRVGLADIEKAIESALARLRATAGDEIEISEDYYWHIPSEAIYDMKTPPKLVVGQLTDDAALVKRLAAGETDAVGTDLAAIAALLRFVSLTWPG